MPTQLMLYMPVIHKGYEGFVERFSGLKVEVLILGRSFEADYPVVRKTNAVRGIQPDRAVRYLEAICGVAGRVVEVKDLPGAISAPHLVVPDEDLMKKVVSDFGLASRTAVTFQRTFLRWDRKQSNTKSALRVRSVTVTDPDASMFARLSLQAGQASPDWWRQVGAIAVRGGVIVGTAFNRHLPTVYDLYALGDPRDSYRRGQRLDLSTALHAEAALIASAARGGVCLEGAAIYVSTFPCPSCARLIAATQFSRCFFADGYSTMAGARVLSDARVEVVRVDVDGDRSSRQMSFEDVPG